MKKKILSLLFISFFLFMPFVHAYDIEENNDIDESLIASNGYYINNYDVKMDVHENHVIDITETIKVVYTVDYKHGIKRNIPYKNSYYRIVDGEQVRTTEKSKIKNISCDARYTKTKEDGEYILKIGDPNNYAEKNKLYTYVIKYTYDAGDDLIDEYDDLYMNIIGTNWDTFIRNVTFTINMPKEFDKTLINFPNGSYGSTRYENVKYEINGSKVTGYLEKDRYGTALSSYSGLTVRIELPEGYYVNERVNHDYTSLLLKVILGVFIFIIGIGLYLFIKYGLRKKDLLVVEYRLPEYTPAEAGYLYYGYTKNNQIVSLITWFASKGLLQIIEDGKKKFSLKKTEKDPGSVPDYALTTYNGLFKKANEYGVVKSTQLTNKFYTSLAKAISQLGKSHKIYEESHYALYVFYIFALVTAILIYPLSSTLFTFRIKYFSTLRTVDLCLIPITIILCILFMILNRKRNEEAEKEYSKVRGFREFLLTVEKDKLETLVEENPNLFYDILPYAYALGVSDKWSKKFESITMSPPDWYLGSSFDTFDVTRFNNSLNNTMSHVSAAMVSRPYESYSSGSSGGGSFSGGGGGGGGGSSW